MSGIIERVTTIVKSNVNDLIDKFEDPEKMINQAILDATAEYGKLKEEAASVIANEKITKKELDRLNNEADSWHNIAAKALKAGNEEDAKTALAREVTYREQAEKQKVVYESSQAASAKVQDKLSELANQIEEMKRKSSQIKSTMITAKATKTAAKISAKDVSRGTADTFARMEEKANRELAEAEALEDMNRNNNEEENLKSKYATFSDYDIDEALAKLKEEIE